MDITNNTALITGASGGIGEEFAVQLAARGVNLVLVARRVEKLEELRARLTAAHPALQIDLVPADLSVPGSGAELAAKVEALGRRIDILINNAGVGTHGKFATQQPEPNAAQIQLNCGTLVDLTARYLPPMIKARHGLVINVASTAAFQPTPAMAVYGATKAFVLSFTEALWQETKGTGVRVFALCPGATETEFFARTGEEFMTRGRQTSKQVVDTALAAIDKTSPTVISGLMNTILANGYRITPRRVLVQVAEQIMKSN
ncbi:MAG: SDR family oxidoreductase [Mycobacterium sp.]|nr:SDR family oxidoreductase [Mycobacterium sp.]